MNGVWQKAGARIREALGQAGYETWIGPLTLVGLQDRTATIEAPNRFFCDWVNDRYLDLIRQTISAEVGEPVEIKLTLSQDPNGDGHGHGHAKTSGATPAPLAEPERRGFHQHLSQRHTFAEFVVGPSNQFAHAAALAVANQPGEKYNPLFIYGGVGLGKTHLASAIGHHLWATRSRARKILFMSAEVFMNELISSLRRDRMGEFKEKFRRADALILDDVQFLAGRERTQEEFFHTFNSLHADGHQIVLTSDKAPRDIAGLEERLRNRFESGLLADIAAPDLETRIAIVQKKAAAERLTLASEVVLWIAQNISLNVRELEGSLTRLAALASMANLPITVDFARQALRDMLRNREYKPDIDSIQRIVADHFHIKLAELKSKK